MNLCCDQDFIRRLRKQFSAVVTGKGGGATSKTKTHYVLYGLSGCPYCTSAVDELKRRNKVAVSEVHLLPDGATSQAKVAFKQSIARAHADYDARAHTTFPVIFKDDHFLGGFDMLIR